MRPLGFTDLNEREMRMMNCMNGACRCGAAPLQWKKGWGLKSGGFATLCFDCGSAYENSVFCEAFHLKEPGWRECRFCGKRIHCGCIASRNLFEYMDLGGIACTTCAKRLEIHSVRPILVPGDIPNGKLVTNSVRDVQPIPVENQLNDDKSTRERLLQLPNAIKVNHVASAPEQVKQQESMLKMGESSKQVLNLSQQGSSLAFLVRAENSRSNPGIKSMLESQAQPSLTSTIPSGSSSTILPFTGGIVDKNDQSPSTIPSGSSSTVLPFTGGIVDRNDQSKASFQHEQKNHNTFSNPPKLNSISSSETNKGAPLQTPVARPPADGRGRSQLLPRYWPRITDQELQQLSGNLKSNVVPLFEKILSASDAGRIGRLVLPKACAEAYFPTINQSDGIPMRIQDTTGKEWTFQFRFWPNNNSRMYVLEGITPCIQNLQLQAGDTVIFSRIDPGGQLLIGCRKALNVDGQDAQTSAVFGSDIPVEKSSSGANENQTLNGGGLSDESQQQSMASLEKKKARNIKNKRLLMHNDDATELRITWEEAQELFHPSPSAEPTVVMVEGHEFEEFEEPPIFGRRTLFVYRPSGDQEQLVQCDSCLKWRVLPAHALISENWTCSDNMWDSNRHSCSAPEEISPKDLKCFDDSKKLRIPDSMASSEGELHSGLDALATAAVLGDEIGDLVESSVGETTRHPRHRPGCTCIVCIQPPSGKGKHDPTCKCNVCLTVKRRFKTLMLRKKQRQSSEHEAEAGQQKDNTTTQSDSEKEDIARRVLLNMSHTENKTSLSDNFGVVNKGQLDLNIDPHQEDEALEAAALPFATYMGQNETVKLEPSSETAATSEGIVGFGVEQANNRPGDALI